MRHRLLLPALMVAVAVSCENPVENVLDVDPTSEVPEDIAIVDRLSAQAALAGLYDALQDGSYYGGEYLFFNDLLADDVLHTGTFTNYADAEVNDLRAHNTAIEAIWESLYGTVGRANQLIAKIPNVPGLADEEKADMIGQAYFVRALTFHNLTRVWGDIPLPLTPPASVDEASKITRSSVSAVYEQILSDLDAAEERITLNTDDTRKATPGAIEALRSRVLLYMEDWAGAEASAAAVLAMGYELEPNFANLFTAEGQDTDEDIFRVAFTAQEYNLIGYYYIRRTFGGRWEITPTCALLGAYDPNFDPGNTAHCTRPDLNWHPTDVRARLTVGLDGRRIHGVKYPTAVGAEDVHVIRLAEVILIKAEAHARQGELLEAVTELNKVRARAEASLFTYVPGVTRTEEVLDAIWAERLLELAFEGDRWPDLVRTGRAVEVMDLADRPHQTLWPLPQNELDVAPGLSQNPGY